MRLQEPCIHWFAGVSGLVLWISGWRRLTQGSNGHRTTSPSHSQQLRCSFVGTGSSLSRAVLRFTHTEIWFSRDVGSKDHAMRVWLEKKFSFCLCVPSCPLWLEIFRHLLQQLPRFLYIFPRGFKIADRQTQRQLSVQ